MQMLRDHLLRWYDQNDPDRRAANPKEKALHVIPKEVTVLAGFVPPLKLISILKKNRENIGGNRIL